MRSSSFSYCLHYSLICFIYALNGKSLVKADYYKKKKKEKNQNFSFAFFVHVVLGEIRIIPDNN